MRALVQRVLRAEVEAEGVVTGRIERGLLVYLGVVAGDSADAASWMAEKVAGLRIFDDEAGKLNRSVQDLPGSVLVVSNFTLLADARKGRRPTFSAAASAAEAQALYDAFVERLRRLGVQTACGVFQATMAIHSVADGPVNVIIDSPAPGKVSGEAPAKN